ncbi:MAG: nucleotide sugar dehydrogenase [Chloroflexota bacterium]
MMLQQESQKDALERKIAARQARVGIMGLGYAGLPMAVEIANAGFHVTGFDVSLDRVTAIQQGTSPVSDVSSETIAWLVNEEMLSATVDFDALADVDCVVICVPTPLQNGRDPDLTYVRNAAAAIRDRLHPGMLIALQSTCSPGTTRNVLLPILAESGLDVGREYFVVFAPERIDPGNEKFNVKNTPKLIGGVTPDCTALASRLYRYIVDTIEPVSSPEVAELSKLVENTFRFINISFVNELAMLCDRMGVNVWEVVDAAATKPFAFMKHTPGPGVGGHCIPIVPFYLQAVAREFGLDDGLIKAAGDINDRMPGFVVQKLARLLSDRGRPLAEARVLCLGVTYKADVADLRESAALNVIGELAAQAVDVCYHDPLIESVAVAGTRYESISLNSDVLQSMDAVILLTAHREVNYELVLANSSLLLDTQNKFKLLASENIVPL